MKTVGTALRNHLDQEVTALCTCWSIEREDGVTLRFTDADEDVVQGGNTYKSIGAYKRTAIETTSTLSVDNLDVVGASSDLALPEEDLRLGLFDNATVTIFMTSWMDSVKGQLKLRRGFFGETQTLPNGTYQVELRGIMQRLAYTYTEVFSPTCLYDLGSPECGVPIKPGEAVSGNAYAIGDIIQVPNSAFNRGAYIELGWGDPDFEIAGENGLDLSQYWVNRGAVPFTIDTDTPLTGTYLARGGASGNSSLTQDIDLLDQNSLDETKLDNEQYYLSANTFRRDTADTGRFRVQFLDKDDRSLGYGRQLTLGGGGISATPFDILTTGTLEMWVKLSGVIDEDQSIYTTGGIGLNQVGQRMDYSTGKLRFVDKPISNVSAAVLMESSRPMAAGEWVHIAVVRENNDLRLYENFELTATGTITSALTVEQWFAGDGTSTTGVVDELRVWDTARTVSELKQTSRKSIDYGTANLIRYHNFNDGTADDQTGNDAGTITYSGTIAQGNTNGIAVSEAHTTLDASYNSGYANVGTSWTQIGMFERQVPCGTRRVRFYLEATGAGARFDNLTGYIIDTAEPADDLEYIYNNVAFQCTVAGSGSGSISTSGGVGSTLTYGTAEFVGIEPLTHFGRVRSSSDARTFIIEVVDSRAVDAWYNGGAAVFQTGPNAGVSMEIKSWDATTRQIELFLSVPNNIKSGDYLMLYPGCDKTRISCAAIFRNVKNFFGTPDVPGQDELFKYPDARQ